MIVLIVISGGFITVAATLCWCLYVGVIDNA